MEIWSAARGQALMPCRTDIELSRLKDILPQIAMLSVVSPTFVDVRLAGSAYRDIFGFEPTAHNLIEVTPPEIRRLRGYRFYTAATHPCGGLAILDQPYRESVSDRVEFLALPLETDTPEQPRKLICAIDSILGRRWTKQDADPSIGGPAEIFQFVDIGAGVPDSIDPPDDFTVE